MKGSLPLLILQVLSSGAKHGYAIAQEIKQQSSGILDFAEGTLYPTLHSLENQGMIESFEEARNGRTRRSYRLTDAGHTALIEERREWQQYSQAVNGILGGQS